GHDSLMRDLCQKVGTLRGVAKAQQRERCHFAWTMAVYAPRIEQRGDMPFVRDWFLAHAKRFADGFGFAWGDRRTVDQRRERIAQRVIADLGALLIDGSELIVDTSAIDWSSVGGEDERLGGSLRRANAIEQTGRIKEYGEASASVCKMLP